MTLSTRPSSTTSSSTESTLSEIESSKKPLRLPHRTTPTTSLPHTVKDDKSQRHTEKTTTTAAQERQHKCFCEPDPFTRYYFICSGVIRYFGSTRSRQIYLSNFLFNFMTVRAIRAPYHKTIFDTLRVINKQSRMVYHAIQELLIYRTICIETYYILNMTLLCLQIYI